jgi:hypothetical protein
MRLTRVQIHKLLDQMWATPAHTSEGRRAKLNVLLGRVLGEKWYGQDGELECEMRKARDMMIEFVGGEPAEQLRDQFRVEPGSLLT